jgi:hypothetical protein
MIWHEINSSLLTAFERITFGELVRAGAEGSGKWLPDSLGLSATLEIISESQQLTSYRFGFYPHVSENKTREPLSNRHQTA